MSTFAQFSPRLQQAIVARLAWSSLRPVQELAGEALLAGRNVVILAPTAGGKTEAAFFPVLSRMVDTPPTGVGAIYVAPIKALLNNQAERLGLYTEMVGLRRFVWHGDTPDSARRQFLADPADVLMTTPESLEVLLISRRVTAETLFADVRVFVIDEVHAMAGTDRGAHLMSVLERVRRLSRHDVQRAGLSATVGNPGDILAWLTGTSRREGAVIDPPRPPAKRQLLVAYRPSLDQLAAEAAKAAKARKSFCFCQSRATTEAVAEQMRRADTAVFVHHSAISREEREAAEARFQHGGDACIVCTSTLELGIDVGDLDRVLQVDAPDTVSSFLQRMGRTGRRPGQTANTTFLCESDDSVLQALALIELARAGWVEAVALDDRCWPVLVHQLLAMSLAGDGVTVADAWAHLSVVQDFRGIRRTEFDRLLNWMLHDGALRLPSGRLILGPKAEHRFGRKNFVEFFAVFSSPQTYTVQTSGGQPIGTLTQAFVDRLVDGVTSFLLGGRAWAVASVHHDERRVIVQSAPRGRQPTWGGFLPQFLGREVCQRILTALLRDDPPPYLEATAKQAFLARQAGTRALFEMAPDGIEVGDTEITWWTFAGGRVNTTLRYALLAVGGSWQVIPDNFALRVRGDGLTRTAFSAALSRLCDIEIWEDSNLWAGVARSLPSYRLSKFQPLMPPWIEREVVARYLLDVAGAWQWLTGTTSTLSRVPEAVHVITAEDERRAAALRALDDLPALTRDPSRRLVFVRSAAELQEAADQLSREEIIGLDVETSIATQTLCLLQLAGRTATYLVDALAVADLGPLRVVLEGPAITKVIHNASFEQEVLRRHELEIGAVVDTMDLSRRARGTDVDGGHSLRAVCARELGKGLDKSYQKSDWATRPLTAGQIEYAALDAEVLLRLHAVFAGSIAQRTEPRGKNITRSD